MSMHRSLATALWLLAAVGVYAVAASLAGDAQTGKIHPWALVALFWGAALVSVAIHHLSRFLSDCLAEGADSLKRYGPRLKPVVGLHVMGVSDHLAQTLGVLKRSWAEHRPSLHTGPELLKGYWAQHRATAGPSQAIPAVGGPSPTFAARLGALIGVR
jgi:hypothetical protein